MTQKHYLGYLGVSKLKSPCQNTPGNKFLASGDPFWTILNEIWWFLLKVKNEILWILLLKGMPWKGHPFRWANTRFVESTPVSLNRFWSSTCSSCSGCGWAKSNEGAARRAPFGRRFAPALRALCSLWSPFKGSIGPFPRVNRALYNVKIGDFPKKLSQENQKNDPKTLSRLSGSIKTEISVSKYP